MESGAEHRRRMLDWQEYLIAVKKWKGLLESPNATAAQKIAARRELVALAEKRKALGERNKNADGISANDGVSMEMVTVKREKEEPQGHG